MFTGIYEYRVDEKGRVPIPPKFRTDELKKEGVMLRPGTEKCITLYPLSEWQKLASSLTTGPIIPTKMRKLNRAIFATAFNADIDGQGRISIPLQLRQYAGIEDEVVIAGTNTYVELWGKQQWEDEIARCQEEAGQIIETLEQH
ncbi:MAG: division/cell wall cluster transcriptional repressor MraZ [Dehalococcoidales bacterium]|nr:division/cell wall cluster transcriptional repressor MraZ [Dehalococcoidales bacterium]